VAGAAVLITASASGYNIGFRPAASSGPAAADTTSVAQASSASAICTDFISHVAGDLGKTQDQVNAAIQKAIGQTIADQVKSGKLTQKQADAITQRLAKQPLCTLPAGLSPKPAGAAPVRPAAYLTQLEAAAASALGITTAQLQADLAGGMSLSQIAAAQNPPVSEGTFRTRLIGQLKPLLDAAVAGKHLTQAQENRILAALQTGPIPFWSRPAPKAPAAAVPSPA